MAGVAWRSVLNRCGLTYEAVTAITHKGYADTDNLDLVTKETIHTFVNNLRKRKEIVVPTPNPHHLTARSGSVHILSNTENKLLAFHHWIHIRSDRGEPIDSALFQAPDLKGYMIHLRNASDGDDKDSAELVAKPSTKFSNDTHFPSWQRKLTNYLDDKNGKTGTPLSYVIREEDAVPPPAEVTLLATAHKQAIVSTNVARPFYESDNGRVWGLQQELSKGGPTWWFFIANCSSTARDGNEAFKSLVMHYEGAAQQSRSKQAAYVIITSSTYDGERKHHPFETFLNKLAHLSLPGRLCVKEIKMLFD
jgi:hypothetical protein